MKNKKIETAGMGVIDLGGKVLSTNIDNVSSSCRVDAYTFCVTLGTAIDMFLKDAHEYTNNPNEGAFVDMKISAMVLVKHLRSEKFVKVGLK
jgi:hypothetical protein